MLVAVILKPTDHMEDEVMLTGIALGGLSEVGAGGDCSTIALVLCCACVVVVFSVVVFRFLVCSMLLLPLEYPSPAVLLSWPSAQVPEEQYINAWASRSIAGQLGPFGHKPHVLNDLLAGNWVMVPVVMVLLVEVGCGRRACPVGKAA
jgi:hypothetical protein